MNINVYFVAVFLVQDVQAGCQDVDSVACGVLLKSDPQLCQKQCLADICRATCGFCRKIMNQFRYKDVLCTLQCILSVSLACPFLISPSVFSHVYLHVFSITLRPFAV